MCKKYRGSINILNVKILKFNNILKILTLKKNSLSEMTFNFNIIKPDYPAFQDRAVTA